jgi:hypothetical protein
MKHIKKIYSLALLVFSSYAATAQTVEAVYDIFPIDSLVDKVALEEYNKINDSNHFSVTSNVPEMLSATEAFAKTVFLSICKQDINRKMQFHILADDALYYNNIINEDTSYNGIGKTDFSDNGTLRGGGRVFTDNKILINYKNNLRISLWDVDSVIALMEQPLPPTLPPPPSGSLEKRIEETKKNCRYFTPSTLEVYNTQQRDTVNGWECFIWKIKDERYKDIAFWVAPTLPKCLNLGLNFNAFNGGIVQAVFPNKAKVYLLKSYQENTDKKFPSYTCRDSLQSDRSLAEYLLGNRL